MDLRQRQWEGPAWRQIDERCWQEAETAPSEMEERAPGQTRTPEEGASHVKARCGQRGQMGREVWACTVVSKEEVFGDGGGIPGGLCCPHLQLLNGIVHITA